MRGFTLIELLIVLAIIGVVVLVLLLVPLLHIWAANTLFQFEIPYTLKTWFAALVLAGLFSRWTLPRKGKN